MPVFPIIYTHLHIINQSPGMIFTIQMEREWCIIFKESDQLVEDFSPDEVIAGLWW